MKKKVVYTIKESHVMVNEELHTSYGISCSKNGETLVEVDDISTDRKAVEALAKLCNSLELEPIHLEEVAEDYIV